MTANTGAQAFSIAFRVEAGCVEARVTGLIDSPEAAVMMFMQIAARLQGSDASRVLVLDEADGSVPTADEFAGIVHRIRDSGLERARVAYVDVPGSAVARMEVGEVIARERGFAVKVFDHEALARIWLSYGEA